MTQLLEVKVPDIGDFDAVEVIEILVGPGATVAAEQSLITVESDKASMEIPSPVAGVVRELRIALGDKVAQGSLILMLEPLDAALASAAASRARLRLLRPPLLPCVRNRRCVPRCVAASAP
jgi:pyruvate/2-oxoglutarate dehydrogenase complex dihydrolipoamide acyltransferase (E2) component